MRGKGKSYWNNPARGCNFMALFNPLQGCFNVDFLPPVSLVAIHIQPFQGF